ncbi:Auxin efflux carrier [Carpediemonas membranifera]|uniref:Auxin efflux carrier n=1 Tax=Carpediemonas membranifera TaxID=201153 RepID=A0A8J6E1U8_9EUKA|nr:Auxin efflux carrier [Carpediemonas membranifera]|eukprot:KAG9393506.1 Auxin efflux carrier [Carpediemonas membranifera]
MKIGFPFMMFRTGLTMPMDSSYIIYMLVVIIQFIVISIPVFILSGVQRLPARYMMTLHMGATWYNAIILGVPICTAMLGEKAAETYPFLHMFPSILIFVPIYQIIFALAPPEKDKKVALPEEQDPFDEFNTRHEQGKNTANEQSPDLSDDQSSLAESEADPTETIAPGLPHTVNSSSVALPDLPIMPRVDALDSYEPNEESYNTTPDNHRDANDSGSEADSHVPTDKHQPRPHHSSRTPAAASSDLESDSDSDSTVVVNSRPVWLGVVVWTINLVRRSLFTPLLVGLYFGLIFRVILYVLSADTPTLVATAMTYGNNIVVPVGLISVGLFLTAKNTNGEPDLVHAGPAINKKVMWVNACIIVFLRLVATPIVIALLCLPLPLSGEEARSLIYVGGAPAAIASFNMTQSHAPKYLYLSPLMIMIGMFAMLPNVLITSFVLDLFNLFPV